MLFEDSDNEYSHSGVFLVIQAKIYDKFFNFYFTFLITYQMNTKICHKKSDPHHSMWLRSYSIYDEGRLNHQHTCLIANALKID